MRFEFYTSALENVPKLCVDGTVPNSIHFSHWEGNQTPIEVKADTSTEIALNLVASPNRNELTAGLDLVTNNHFDTDGVLSVWTVMNGTNALRFREQLIAAAEAGDFSEYSSKAGVCISLAVQGGQQASPNDDTGSPLARFLAGEEVEDDARAYELVLPEVERLLTDIDQYEPLWAEGWKRVSDALASFESGHSKVEEIADANLSIVTLAPEIFSGHAFSPTKHAAPFTAISKFARGELFLIAIPAGNGTWFYRVDYPYYSWAETVVRPRVRLKNLYGALKQLNERDTAPSGSWKMDNREMTSAIKFLDAGGALAPSGLAPYDVAEALTNSLLQQVKTSAAS